MKSYFSLIGIVFVVAVIVGMAIREGSQTSTKPALTVKVADSGTSGDLPPPSPMVIAANTIDLPAPPPARFSLLASDDLSLILSGVVPTEAAKSALVEAVQRVAPELITIENRIGVDPASGSPTWLGRVPDLLVNLISTVQEPELKIDRTLARIGGATDDKTALASLRRQFSAVFAAHGKVEDDLEFDDSKPTPNPQMPLVFFMGAWEGKVLFEGSVPTAGDRKAIIIAAVAAKGADAVVDRLRISSETVDETWLPQIPDLVAALLDKKVAKAQFNIADRKLTVIGVLPDKKAKEHVLEILKPIHEADYEVVDELIVKP